MKIQRYTLTRKFLAVSISLNLNKQRSVVDAKELALASISCTKDSTKVAVY